jgi:DNA-binding response OmpR family regulator
MDSTGSIVQSDSSHLLGKSLSSTTREGRDRVSGDAAAVAGFSTVLLLEDDPEVVARIAHCLSQGDYRTLAVATVEMACALAQKRAVAVVLLNWRLLTQLGGSALVNELRRRSPHAHLPMIVISAEHSELMEATQLGIDDYLPNPFHADDLLHVVDEYCC